MLSKRRSKTGIVSVVVLAILCTACPGGKTLIQSVRAALAASDPLINSLVASGAINSAFAGTLRKDFSDGVNCADTLSTAFSAIPKDDPDGKRKKLNASVNAARCFKVIVERQNFAQNEKTRTAASIVEGILASLVIFYSEPGEMRVERSSGVKVITASDEKELEKKLKAEVERLKKVMKGE